MNFLTLLLYSFVLKMFDYLFINIKNDFAKRKKIKQEAKNIEEKNLDHEFWEEN